MPTGQELIQLILSGGLTGRALAGIQPPAALAGFGDVRPTPTFVPSPSGVGPMITGGGMPALPGVNLPPIATPGDPGSSSLAIGPDAPLDFNSALERARAAASGILGPDAPAAPEKGPGALSTILQILAQGVTAAMSRDPGAALQGFQNQALALKQQKQQQQQQQKERREALTAQIFSGEVASDRRAAEEKRREQRQDEREFQAYQNRQREILGEQAYRANEAELTRIWQDKRDQERERAADEKQKAAFEQQLKIQKGQLRKQFLDQGAGNYADELADYALGTIDKLSPGAEKANTLIQAKIARLQGLAARGSGGGGGGRSGGGGKVETWAVLSDGSTVQADKVNIDRLPAGVTVKQLFSTQGGVPVGQAGARGGPLTKEQIEQGIVAAQQRRVPQIQIAQQMRALPEYGQNKALIERMIKLYNLEAPPAPIAAPTPDLRPESERVKETPLNKLIQSAPGIMQGLKNRYEEQRRKEAANPERYQ